MAAGGFKEFVAGEILDEDDINDFLMQGVLVFAGTAARGSAIGTAVEGQFAFLKDTDTLTYYSGTAWEELASIPSAVVSATSGTPTLGTVTSGGDTFNIYSYTGDGSITFSSAGTVDGLVLGGGGGGGSSSAASAGGGGAAGGIVRLQSFFVNAGTVTVDVGAGGAADSFGFASSFGSLAVPAGARGGDVVTDLTTNGFAGASGGGGGSGGVANRTGGQTVLAAQGNNGGNSTGSSTGSQRAGGGGGGSGAVGANSPTTSTGGAGGAGIESDITGTSLFYAAGGGGGARTTGGAGGSSIGGAGGTDADGGNATANRGSGGGGAGNSTVGRTGGSGSDGVVIVRVKV